MRVEFIENACKELQVAVAKAKNENRKAKIKIIHFFSSVALPLAELVREADGGHQLSGCHTHTHTQSTEREREAWQGGRLLLA